MHGRMLLPMTVGVLHGIATTTFEFDCGATCQSGDLSPLNHSHSMKHAGQPLTRDP